jgi:hypothetical protein
MLQVLEVGFSSCHAKAPSQTKMELETTGNLIPCIEEL